MYRTAPAPVRFARPILLVVRTIFVVTALSVAVALWMGALQRANTTAADIGVAVATGLVIGVLCPEHWVWAAPFPIVVGAFQSFQQALGTAPYWGDEHDGILFLVFVIYTCLALFGASVGWFVVRSIRRLGVHSVRRST